MLKSKEMAGTIFVNLTAAYDIVWNCDLICKLLSDFYRTSTWLARLWSLPRVSPDFAYHYSLRVSPDLKTEAQLCYNSDCSFSPIQAKSQA